MDLVRAMLVLSDQFAGYASGYESSAVLVSLPEPITQRIADVSRYLVPDMELCYEPDGTAKGREWDTHITVKYGLQTNNPLEALRIIDAAQIGPFEIALGPVGVFEQATHDVVKIDVISDGLAALHEALKAGLPNTEAFPVYRPHVTLAYVKRGFGAGHVGATDFVGLKFTCDRVKFTPSHGPGRTLPLFGVTL